MSLIDSDVAFYSNWDIDLILDQGDTVVSGTLNSLTGVDILVFTHNLGYVPTFDLTFLPTGGTQWQQIGDQDTTSLIAYVAYATTTQLFVSLFNDDPVSNHTFNTDIRYYIWTDTVVH